jgi:MOSC domain-containing protein YiiM
MTTGTVEAIFITGQASGPMTAVDRVEAIAGAGLAGDRYGEGAGTFSKSPKPYQQVSLIEAEAVEGAAREYDLELAPGETRRNIVTRGIALNHLVDREFTVGGARLRGIKLCEPCGHLEKLTREGVRKSLIHRGGLRAEVVGGGAIAVGDEVLRLEA